MKQTFSQKYLDWVLIGISLVFSVESILNLIEEFDFYSSYILRIAFAIVSLFALFSLIVKKLNGERYSRIFLISVLIIPATLILNLFLTDLIFYGVNRLNLLQNPILFLKLIIGISLFALTIKYSKQTKSDRIKDYGILTIFIGFFAITYITIRAVEPLILTGLNNVPIWKIMAKSIIGLLVVYFGYRLKNGNMKLKICVILALISVYTYGLI